MLFRHNWQMCQATSLLWKVTTFFNFLSLQCLESKKKLIFNLCKKSYWLRKLTLFRKFRPKKSLKTNKKFIKFCRIMKKDFCGKIIYYQFLQEKLRASKIENFKIYKSFDQKKNFFIKMMKKFKNCLESWKNNSSIFENEWNMSTFFHFFLC